MAVKKPRTAVTDVSILLNRIAKLEKRVMKIEAERDAALSAAAKTKSPVLAPAASLSPDATAILAPSQTSAAPSPAAIALVAPRGEVTDEILMVISAAVAAFLGKRAHVRQIRFLGSTAWAEQGRVSVMASHRWAMQRG
jgi:methylmalonyl-CoA carboxyltransferase large subunit